jgi:two-component system sensor histidine kinase/response regulator
VSKSPRRIDPQGLLDALTEPVLAWDAAGRLLHANSACREQLGWDTAGLAAAGASALSPAGDPLAAALLDAPARLAAAGGQLRLGTCLVRSADGALHRTRARLATFTTAAGEPAGYLLQLRPCGQAMAEMEQFRAVFESATDGIFIKDRELRYLAVNPTLCAIHGRAEAEIVGRRAADLFPAAIAAVMEATDRRVLAGERVEMVLELTMPDGVHTVEIAKSPVRDADGAILGLCAIARNVTEARRLESALRGSEEKLRALSENLPGVLFSYLRQADGTQVEAYHSSGLERIVGRDNAERIRRGELDYRDLIHPGDRAKLPKHRTLPGQDRLSLEAEYRVDNGEGGYRWVHVRSSRLPLPDGGAQCHGVLLDVDERKGMDAALGELSGRLQALTDQMPGIVFSYRRLPNGSREAVYISPGLEQLIGPELAWRIQQDMDAMHALVHPADRAAIVDGDKEEAAGQLSSDVEYRTLTDSGEYRWMYSRAKGLVQPDGAVLWHGFIVDIDERKRIEEALHNTSLRLQTLADNLPGLVYSYRRHPDGRREHIYLGPRGLEEIVGPRNAARMRADLDYHDTLLHPDEKHSFAPLRPGRAADPLQFNREYRLRHDDGDYRWVDSRSTGFPQPDGSVIWHGLMIDISRRKRVEGELRLHSDTLERTNRDLNEAILQAAQAIEARGRFLATMSHEIRTPLTAILGFAELLLEAPAPERLEESLELIRDNGHYLLRIINDVLDYSKIEAGKLSLERERFAPAMLLGELLALMRVRAEAKGLSLELDLDPRLPEALHGDATRLRQILLNLLGNAIKFTRRGGITLRCCYTEDEPRRLRFEVEDTGIGLPPGDPERLFEAFVQGDATDARSYGGTGLGLAISRSLARLLGGDLTARSTPIGGACFSLCLPADLEPAPEPAATPDHSVAGLEGRILVVEDNATNRLLVRLLLEAAGAAVDEAADGRAALARVEAAAAAGTPYAAILMDIQMPELDGYEVTRRLRALGCRTPVVALTAHALDGHRERCLAAGCDAYCAKPIDRDELLAVLATQIAARSAES